MRDKYISDSTTHHLMIFDKKENIFINYYYQMLGKPKITRSSKLSRFTKIEQIMSDPTSGISKFSQKHYKRLIINPC